MASLTRTEWWMLAAVIVLIALAPKQANAAQPDQEQQALLVGDSLAVGLDSPLVTLLRAENVALTTHAQEGTVASYWTARVGQLLRQKHYDVLFVSLGTNDCRVANSIACADFAMQARKINAWGRAYGTQVVFLVPSWLPESWVRRVRDAILSFDATKIECIPIEVSSDGIHPTRGGYAQWAEEVVDQWRNL